MAFCDKKDKERLPLIERTRLGFGDGLNIISAWKCNNISHIKSAIKIMMREMELRLPSRPDGLILIKPNLNNDLNALIGNSTDLRLLVAVIEWLKNSNYDNIVVGDGSNVGVNRRNIDVFNRLRIDRIANFYGIKLKDLNQDAWVKKSFFDCEAKISKISLDAEMIINMPKIKTHAEAVMSVGLKNFMGCVVGQDKRKMHSKLSYNIVRLNEIISPEVHIVDGIVAMEGNGPGDGCPRDTGFILTCKSAFVTDFVCARLMGIDWKDVEYLRICMERGHITKETIEEIEKTFHRRIELELPPKRHLMVRAADHRLMNRFKIMMRPVTSLFAVTNLAYKLNIVQDVYSLEDDQIKTLKRNEKKCSQCGRCEFYCPMEIPTPLVGSAVSNTKCIKCLYCFFVCPNGAIEIYGKKGFLANHIARFGDKIKKSLSEKST